MFLLSVKGRISTDRRYLCFTSLIPGVSRFTPPKPEIPEFRNVENNSMSGFGGVKCETPPHYGLASGVTFGGCFVLSYLWYALGLVLAAMFGGGFVLSYRWFELGVGFGRPEININERPFRDWGRCGLAIGDSSLAAVSFYPIAGSR